MKTVIFALLFLISSPSFAAKGICDEKWSNLPSMNYMKKEKTIIPEELKIEGVSATDHVRGIVKKYLKNSYYTGNKFDDAIDLVAVTIRNTPSLSALEKSNKMAEFARDLNPVFEKMLEQFPAKGTKEAPDLVSWRLRKQALDEVKTLKYKISKEILSFEEIPRNDFVKVDKEEVFMVKGDNFQNMVHLAPNDYPEYVESLMHSLLKTGNEKAKLYENIDLGGGVLTIKDIRDITSYNLFPIYAKRHDMRHVHFALSHPMALSVMMKSSRSLNNQRYVMMAGLYEAVETFQFSHEIALANFFGKYMKETGIAGIKRGMDLEEAMLTIATSTDEDLKKIVELSGCDASGGSYTVGGLTGNLNNWKPPVVPGTAINGKPAKFANFDQELETMVNKFTELMKKAEKINQKLLDAGAGSLTADEEIFMKMMNYQVNPENPSIVIEGIQFKNDGRAHSGDAQEYSIGIGDQ